MTNAETLLSEDIALDVFKKLIFHHLRISKPIIQLKNIPHWIGFLGQIGLSDSPLDQLKTFLIGGYFYNFSSRVPPLSSLNELDKFSNVDLLMVPTVRDTSNTDLLKENGFLEIPFFIESAFKFHDLSLEEILSKNIGGKQFRYMRRCSEKARSFSSYSFFSAQDLLQNPQLLEYAAMLHSFNTNKYNHPINFYNLESLKTILASPLNPYFYICIRFGKNDVPLQVGIFLIDKNRSHLYFLAQGINHIAHTSDVNLYIALFFEAFSFAEYLSLEEVHLGRANHLTKKRLGANAFYLLSNWMKPLNNLYSPLITSLSQKGSSFLNIKDYQFT